METETAIFTIISYGGDAKAIAYEALESSYDGNFELAQEKLDEANSKLTEAHNTQTKLIQSEINGEKIEMSLLMVHAQDHLMTSISEISLIEKMIKMQKRIGILESKLK
ncbi:PTS lactose/cellobiose transporter subunit IIA [Virgibacillus halodenitrificans]|uniref:PTS lactose/cellobiose transporter subunit IIA n=1 Tax=Virgibacillus halodenitrificans TaxID=1482 RepID=UPI000EF535DB|nr:PTS lactose/cellobiose transporter subunit IIA [Virgibacillus halodenitrificans]MYL57620.1 PTS lactose/cellobiose transporter subunit IIA [Virgibacillus halodenitrificans]